MKKLIPVQGRIKSYHASKDGYNVADWWEEAVAKFKNQSKNHNN